MRSFIVVLVVVLIVAGGLLSDPPSEPSAERVDQLIKQLGHKEFAKRQAAGKELDAIGEAALEAPRKAATDNDAEISQRAAKIAGDITDRIRAAAAKKDLEKFQGTWHTFSIESGGTASGEDKADTITYEGTEFIQRRNGRDWASGTFAIVDATASPKQIDYTYIEGPSKGVSARSIYMLVGDDHAICTGQGNNRPTEFSGKSGFLRITKREKNGPAEVEYFSEVLPTDLQLAESKDAVRRVVVKVRPADGGAGALILDPNAAKLNEFGDAVGGGKMLPVVKADFTLKIVKKDGDRRLYEIGGPKIESRLSLVMYRAIGSTDARLLVHGKDGEARYSINIRLPREDRLLPCHPGCFPAGTQVRIPGGAKSIERIREGDLVTAVDSAGKPSPAKVTGVFVTRNRVLELRTKGGTLVTTATQPVSLEKGEFRSAGELKPGDRIWRWVDGQRQIAVVTEVTPADREVEVFNLVLGKPTGFIAGSFLVRSKPPAPAPLP